MIFPGWLVLAAVNFAFLLLGELLRPKPNIRGPRAGTLEEFTVPTATENRHVPIVWGHVRIAPNCVWLGDFEARPIYKKIRSLFGSNKVLIGHNYYVGMQLMLCQGSIHSITGVWVGSRQVWFGEKVIPRAGYSATQSQITLNIASSWAEPGAQVETGVRSSLEILNNPYATNDANNNRSSAYLDARLGAENNPCYAGHTFIVWRGPSWANDSGWVGTRPVAPALTFGVRRYPDLSRFIPQGPGWNFYGWGEFAGNSSANLEWYAFEAATRDIGGDANPAWCLAEVLTSVAFGAGLLGTSLDQHSFCVAAQRLYDENCGMSLKIESPTSVEKIIEIICRHVNGVLRVDPTTGRLAFKLLREEDEPVLDLTPANIAQLHDFSRAGPDELTSEVRVAYRDKAANFSQRYVIAQNPAATEFNNGQVVSTELTFEALTDASLAGVLAMRELRSLSSPLARISLDANVSPGTLLQIGDVVTVNWPEHGISNMRMRIVKAAYKENLTQVSLELLQDMFSAGTGFYLNTPEPPPDTEPLAPVPVAESVLLRAPYALHGYEDGDHVMHYAIQPESTATTAYRLQWSDNPNFPEESTYDDERDLFEPCVTGTLEFELAYRQTGAGPIYVLASDAQRAALARSTRTNILAIIGDAEFIRVGSASVSGTKIVLTNIGRGLFDTPPKRHPAGTKVVLLFDYAIDPVKLDRKPYAADWVYTRTAAVGPGGTTGFTGPVAGLFDEAALHPTRAGVPLPPAAVRLNGEFGSPDHENAPAVSIGSGPLKLQWAPRNKRSRSAADYFDQNSYDPDANIQVGCSIYVADTDMAGNLEWRLHTSEQYASSGTEMTLPLPLEPQKIRVVIWAKAPGAGAYPSVMQTLHWTLIA